MKTPIEMMMDGVDWVKNEYEISEPQIRAELNGLPYATHSGVLHIGGKSLRCHRLSTGQAIIEAEDMNNFFR